jgi:carboxypeptidase Taq
MNHDLNELRTILGEIADLHAAAALLDWDQQTQMPSGATQGRGHQISTVKTLAHSKFTSTEVGRLLDKLEPYGEQLDPDSDEARLIKVTRREFEKQTRGPPEMVAEFAQLTTVAHQAWEEARAENNFGGFLPFAEKIFALRRRYAELFAPYDHVYDPLLDDFEPGLKTADVKEIFDKLRSEQVKIVQEIAEKPQVDSSFLRKHYEHQKQWDFGVEVISKFGYDWKHGRQDFSAHPFTQSIGLQDVRITTRVKEEFLNTALFGTMHECGHALYEQGIDSALDRSPLGTGASLAVHESQSRMWENLVGRSLPFWKYFYPRLQQFFPDQLKGVSLEHFFKGINRVQPSPIRIEADEATYNLHIMLRLEIEIAVLEGRLEVKDLPEAWNDRMQDYLGIVPKNDAEGVLQDVHWSGGMIGYFPTYALGNLISAQLWECIDRDLPDLHEQLRRGEFSTLLRWLRVNLHRYGAKFEPQELVERVTGSKIEPGAYIRYLRAKYGEIYGI